MQFCMLHVLRSASWQAIRTGGARHVAEVSPGSLLNVFLILWHAEWPPLSLL